MKKLQDILYKVNLLEVKGSTTRNVSAVVFDSRKVVPACVFVAVKGTGTDGHSYIDKAIEQGAETIVCECLPAHLESSITYLKVKDASQALGHIAANFFDNPSDKLKLSGVTGTNGKTSIATLSYRLLRSMGVSCGLISTIENRIDDEVIPSTHTTPDAVQLNELLHDMFTRGCRYVFMEVSSHAIHQNRISGVRFSIAAFTNLTHDHLDYHGDFKNYLQAKKKFFDELPSGAIAITNADDKNGLVMLQNTAARKYTYALKTTADFKSKITESNFEGLSLLIDHTEVHTKLAGEFNAYNLTCVYAMAVLLGFEKENVLQHLSALNAPEGRFDYSVSPHDKIVGVVDYAHTPDALKKVLEYIQQIKNGNRRVITVLGCGGNRDAAKRPVMAEVAARLSDQLIITSDNPRNENPDAIIDEMMQAFKQPPNIVYAKRVLTNVNRAAAITTAVRLAQPGDIILLAGKGHEKYQEINGVRHPFDDKKILTETFNQLNR